MNRWGGEGRGGVRLGRPDPGLEEMGCDALRRIHVVSVHRSWAVESQSAYVRANASRLRRVLLVVLRRLSLVRRNICDARY